MTDLDYKGESSGSAITRLWRRIPLLIRVVFSGLLVYAVAGLVAWTLILNLVPVPWSLLAMVVVLWLYWKYFSGTWWYKTTMASRRENFRATKLSTGVWKWSLVAALLVVVIVQSALVITFRILDFPETWSIGIDPTGFPLWVAWFFVIVAASVAGITEEVGFRGYMQVPLEKRYGPLVSIVIVSIVFMGFHLGQAWAPPVLIHLFVFSVLWGTLAYVSGSIVPGVISHAVTDIFSFAYWWTDLAGTFELLPIAETGLDSHFILWILVFMISAALFAGAARKTWAVRQRS